MRTNAQIYEKVKTFTLGLNVISIAKRSLPLTCSFAILKLTKATESSNSENAKRFFPTFEMIEFADFLKHFEVRIILLD